VPASPASPLELHDSARSELAESPRAPLAGLLSHLGRLWSADWLRGRGPAVAFGIVAATCLAAIAASPIHARLYGHDIFFLLDNGWRALHGQRVHLDYSSAWGPLTFLLMAGGLAVSHASVASIGYASAFVACITGFWAAWLALPRFRSAAVIIYPVLVALIAAAPFALGDPPFATSHGMIYNRYGYALLAVILIECFQPASDPRSPRRWIEPALTGCAAALLLFLKITFFLVAVLFFAASLLQRTKTRVPAFAAGFFVVSLLFLAYLRFDIAAMLSDLSGAAAARSGTLGVRHDFSALVSAIRPAVLLGVLAFGCARAARSRSGITRYFVAAGIVLAADCLLCITNAQSGAYPLSAVFALILLLSIEPALRSRTDAPFLLIVAAFVTGPFFLEQSGGLIYAVVEAKSNADPAGVLRFDSPRLRPLVLYDVPAADVDHFSNGREYVSSLNDGMRLIAANSAPSEKVATLDMFNPFAYALDREPIRGGIAAAAYRYTLDDIHHPSPARFFGDAVVVMVPKFPATPPIFFDGYARIYAPVIERDFHLAAESARWKLYRRGAAQ